MFSYLDGLTTKLNTDAKFFSIELELVMPFIYLGHVIILISFVLKNSLSHLNNYFILG